MDNEELQLLDKICKMESDILTMYNGLISLDLQNMKGTEEYQNNLQTLFLFIDLENLLLNNYASSIPLTEKTIDYLSYSPEFAITENNTREIIEQKPDNLVRKRLLSKLKAILLGEPQYFIEDLDSENLETISLENPMIGINYLYEILPTLENTTDMYLYKLLEENLKQTISPDIKDHILKAMYYLSFLNIHLEEMCIKNGFTGIPYQFDNDIDIHFNGIKKETKKRVNDLYAIENAMALIDQLLDIQNQEYNLNTKKSECTILINLLQVYLLYLSEETLSQLQAKVNNEYQENNNTVSKTLIDGIFKTLNQTKKLVNKDFNKGKDKDTI